MKKSYEFIYVIETSGFIDLGFSGQKFTLCNKRGIAQGIWIILDRALVNDNWLVSMP